MKKSSENPADQTEPDDAALFRAAVGVVNPLAEQNRIQPQAPPRKAYSSPATPSSPKIDNLSDFAPVDVPAEYLRNGLSRLSLRKLKLGKWPTQDKLDLHGNQRDTARKLLQEFLLEATNRDLRCVLVIHGKGMNSRCGEAVLRKLTRYWLTQHPLVLGFCDAMPELGGSGAVLVLLKN